MSRQEEIREGIFKVLFPYSNADHYTGDGTVQKVLEYLCSQGVVIKSIDQRINLEGDDGKFVAVESLI